jgi:glycosyltransferase involved in cell wall biosynthesis
MIFIFDSHPVQYKAPIYQQLQKLRPGRFKVFYATDAPMRGLHDPDFDTVVTWDAPLLADYDYTVLHNERGTPLRGFRSLSGREVFQLLRRERPDAVLISQFLYEFDFTAYVSCLLLRIPIWIRHETQDEAFRRPAWKSFLRHFFYRAVYAGVSHAFAIGVLNREHLLRHGVPASRMSLAPYCAPVPPAVDTTLRQEWRREVRERLDLKPEETLVLFSGKLIEKKNPGLLLEAFRRLTAKERKRFRLVFVGAGPLETSLRAEAAEFGDRIHFAGFVNQTEIPQYYAAADILVLPSRRAGETWGLVVNEALQAGCAVVMTRAVGCHREFGDWKRVRVIEESDAQACVEALRELSTLARSFDWCANAMRPYGVEAAAEAFAQQIDLATLSSPACVS